MWRMFNLIIVGQFVNKVDPFYMKVDVLPNYRFIIGGSMSQSLSLKVKKK